MTTLGPLRKWLLESAKALASNAPIPIVGLCCNSWGFLDLVWLGPLYLLGCCLWYRYCERMEDKKIHEAEKVRAHDASEGDKRREFERETLGMRQAFQETATDKLLAHAQKTKQPIAADLTDGGLPFRIGGPVTDLVSPFAAGRAA